MFLSETLGFTKVLNEEVVVQLKKRWVITMHIFSIEQMECLVAFVDTGSYALAAARLNVTAQAVSKNINRMSKALKAPLIERNGKRAQPASFAVDIANLSRPVIRQIHEIEAYMRLREG